MPGWSTRCSVSVSAARQPRAHGDRLTVHCGPMVHGGACMARTDEGEVIFVDGAIPDELCVVELRHRRRKVWYAGVVEVLEASPHRVAAPCPYVPECGGGAPPHRCHTPPGGGQSRNTAHGPSPPAGPESRPPPR